MAEFLINKWKNIEQIVNIYYYKISFILVVLKINFAFMYMKFFREENVYEKI